MPMSSGLSSEGHSSSRAPKAPRSRARLRAQQVAENAQVEAKHAESAQAESAQSQVAKTTKAAEATKSAEAVKPAKATASEGSAQAAATQSSSPVRHAPRKPVVHESHAQFGSDDRSHRV